MHDARVFAVRSFTLLVTNGIRLERAGYGRIQLKTCGIDILCR